MAEAGKEKWREYVEENYSTPEATKKFGLALLAEAKGAAEMAERTFEKAVQFEIEGK